ncbi:MarR family winged helix-turn-helix transcriptional regulator [Maricaulis salignorans]|uniref:DNA-binding transcriptional regulator, MarR family n=1 Tax=Maricaulis salignorans TaxID=144026 RepID=A0A1G9WB58_9PROT|nr:MarR family winged helix-turn-helix transcriptional regulator [Maricaulis salignorans]SDM81245.1 DNA-binding transcriptional regulator, MarR family [Maricaulis salignorans]
MKTSNTPVATRRVIELGSYWPYQLTVLADRISRHTAGIVKQYGQLNLSQWRVMAAIAEQPGRTAAEVVTITPMDKGIVSRATKALLVAGLVRREASTGDGRVSHLFLTGPGETLYQALMPRVEAVSREIHAALSPDEQRRFGALLGRLVSTMSDPSGS